MKTLRREVFYGVNRGLRTGDKFHQIELKQDAHEKGKPFQVEVFTGVAGTPPNKPTAMQSFETRNEADVYFENQVAAAEKRGFLLYDPTIHGPDKPF